MSEKPEGRHPIQVVARRTGLSPDVLRAWEKRYHAVEPSRTPTGRRFYTDGDVERLLLLRRATLAGRSIGQIAAMDDAALREMVVRDETAARPRPAAREPLPAPPSAAGSVEEGALRDCLAAVADLDALGLEATLHRASFALSRPALLDRVLVPLMHEIGARWSDGDLRIAHEHLASTVVRSFLGNFREAGASSPGAPGILVGTPAGQHHELGAAMVGATAASAGWTVTYMGPNLPAEELASSAARLGVRVVAVSIVYPEDDPLLAPELRKLRDLTPEGIDVVLGGSAAARYRTAAPLEGVAGIRFLDDMAGFRAYLRELRRGEAGVPERRGGVTA